MRKEGRWKSKPWSERLSSSASDLGFRCRPHELSMRAPNFWISDAQVAWHRVSRRWRDENPQSLVSTERLPCRDDHDREPSIFLDSFCQTSPAGYRVEAFRNTDGSDIVHPFSDLGSIGAGIVGRSSGS